MTKAINNPDPMRFSPEKYRRELRARLAPSCRKMLEDLGLDTAGMTDDEAVDWAAKSPLGKMRMPSF